MVYLFEHSTELDTLARYLANADVLEDGRFSIRNFLTETDVHADRAENYISRPDVPAVTGNPRADLNSFIKFQNTYLNEQLQQGVRSSPFDQVARECPETFRPGVSLEEYGVSDDNLDLIRVEDVRYMARRAEIAEADLFSILQLVAEGRRRGVSDKANLNYCGHLLRKWQDSSDNRPLFAAFWEDCRLVIEDLNSGWADELRDRLGLAHYDPADPNRLRTAGIPIALFKYSIKAIPRVSSTGPRLLVRPTILDASVSEAFYTAPPRTGAGYAVDLTVRDDEPCREVLHPAVELRAEQVWAVGWVIRSPADKLGASRIKHLLKLSGYSDDSFIDLCLGIDGDLL